ncbi:MAG: hypothetical protein HY238_16045 [Acidobacteria bacterium]|nr:hypothetical protein [Acidobacteriota bacterium]
MAKRTRKTAKQLNAEIDRLQKKTDQGFAALARALEACRRERAKTPGGFRDISERELKEVIEALKPLPRPRKSKSR